MLTCSLADDLEFQYRMDACFYEPKYIYFSEHADRAVRYSQCRCTEEKKNYNRKCSYYRSHIFHHNFPKCHPAIILLDYYKS